jgi:hypothetical protein
MAHNPIQALSLLIEFCQKMKTRFKQAQTRCKQYIKEFQTLGR